MKFERPFLNTNYTHMRTYFNQASTVLILGKALLSLFFSEVVNQGIKKKVVGFSNTAHGHDPRTHEPTNPRRDLLTFKKVFENSSYSTVFKLNV
jgi:hypothetical protein